MAADRRRGCGWRGGDDDIGSKHGDEAEQRPDREEGAAAAVGIGTCSGWAGPLGHDCMKV